MESRRKKVLEVDLPRIKEMILGLEEKNEAILDISAYPELGRILQASTLDTYPTTYFLPDTIDKLLSVARRNPQYYYFLTKLFTRWTQRYIDFRILGKALAEKEQPHVNIQLITEEMIDRETYLLCYEKFVAKDLFVELSPRLNLVGDIIGKMLGFAKKSRVPILMMSRRLIREIREEIPIFETANMFADSKRRMFQRLIPNLEKTRGIRWFVAFTVEIVGFSVAGPVAAPLGFVLTIMDP